MGTKSGFAFDGRGRVDRKEVYTTKNGKDIVTLVLQVEGSYPQLVPVKFFGRVADQARGLAVGSVVEVTGRLGGREWHGKVYADIVGERIEVVAEAPSKQQEMPGTGGGQASDSGWRGQSPRPEDDDVPF